MKFPLLLTGILWFAFLLPSPAQDEAVWLTIDAAMQDVLRTELAPRVPSAASPVTANRGLAIYRIPERDLADLSVLMHRTTHRCGGFVVHDSYEEALTVLIGGDKDRRAGSLAYTVDNGGVVRDLIDAMSEGEIRGTISGLAAFHTRYYTTQTGKDAAYWLRDLWQSYAGDRPDVEVRLFDHPWLQPSVILTIRGAVHPEEFVILGGHLDSIAGFGGGSRAPGADDDASGIAAIGEAARVALAQGYRPDYSVQFMAYAGEETGLRGSRAIADQYRANDVAVRGVLQLDLANYKGSDEDIFFIQDWTNDGQNTFLAQLVDAYLASTWSTTECGYACSDHASWHNEGYVASFPVEARFGEHNPTIHSSSDTLAQSGNSADHALKFAELAGAYVAELAKGQLNAAPLPESTRVTVITMMELRESYGNCPPFPLSCPRDEDGDGDIDETDLHQLYTEWGR